MLKRILLVCAGVLGVMLVVIGVLLYGTQDFWYPRRPANFPFAPLKDAAALKDPDNPIREFRLDMAVVEQNYPITRAQLASLTPEHVRSLAQEELDQLYGRLSAGPIPDGPYSGDLVFPRSDSANESYGGELELALRRLKGVVAIFVPFIDADASTRMGEALGGVDGRLADTGVKFIEKVGRVVWKGKLFNRDK